MHSSTHHRRFALTSAVTALTCAATLSVLAVAATSAHAAARASDPGATSPLFIDRASSTLQAAATLTGQARDDAILLGGIPSARWFTSGTPAEVRAAVDATVSAAAAEHAVPVLVAYNVPFRDCAMYSAGGAADTAAYDAWIDAFAAGIGNRQAIVAVEPDGLGIIPWYTALNGTAEWCQQAGADPATAPAERFAQLNHAVDAFAALPATKVYLDGTHNGWLGVGDATDRLIKAGVARADGFFLNTSNYQPTDKVSRYAGWVSDCLALVTQSWYQAAWCGSQYYPATPTDISTWHLTDAAYDQAFADTGLVRDRATQKHALIDTSRNGQGAWTAPAGVYPDAQDWCNPPGRGLGRTPTLATGDPVIDGFLWLKIPGESDGECTRGTAGPADPERGMVDPAAGSWFVQQAAELIALANPALARPTCEVRPVVHGTWPQGFVSQVTLKNTGTTALTAWKVQFAFVGDQRLAQSWGASVTQKGAVASASNLAWNARVAPGASVTFGYRGTAGSGATSLLWSMNGGPCTVR